jgi:HK97 gp10 family phage protein
MVRANIGGKGQVATRRAMDVKFTGKATPLVMAGGAKALAMSLRKLGDKELSDEMRAASKAAAQEIVPYAQRRAPVVSGKLRASIKADSTRSIARIKAGSPTRVPYARAVHSGRYVNQRTRGIRINPQPFIRKAIPEAWPQLVDKYEKGLNAVAKKFAAKHGAHRVTGRFVKK